MSAAVDEDVVVLEGLGHVPECDCPPCAAEARYACVCRHCRRVVLVCAKHLRELRGKAFAARLLRLKLACVTCDNSFRDFEKGIEVIPL